MNTSNNRIPFSVHCLTGTVSKSEKDKKKMPNIIYFDFDEYQIPNEFLIDRKIMLTD